MLQLPWDLTFESAHLLTDLEVELRYEHAQALFRATLTNRGEQTQSLDRLVLSAEVHRAAAGGYVWLHGRYMQQDSFVHAFGGELDETYSGNLTRFDGEDRRFRSHELVALSLLGGTAPALVVGSLEPARCFVDFEVVASADEDVVNSLVIQFDLRGIQLAPGETFELPTLYLSEGSDALTLVEQFASVLAGVLGARVPEVVPSGWCSWYFFYNRVSESDVLSNLHELSQQEPRIDFVQIDDGFQSQTGDWLLPNERFPSGMASLASRIRESGFKTGLWLAPFVLNEDSQALRDHPDMVLRKPDGEPYRVETWLGRCAVLDCTHPAAEAWLRKVISTVVHEWGYEYLKLDALSYAAATPGRVAYHERNTTAPANLRRGLEIIRGAAGGDTFILGCTCHFGPAIGLVDAMRVGPDVKALWFDGLAPSVKHAMRMTLQRNWMHSRWWLNDPDCLIVRDNETSLTESETRFLATGIALSGGMVVLSDDLPSVSAQRRDLARALIPPAGVAARPVTPSEEPIARLWRTELGHGRSLVGALNWSDEPSWMPRDALLRPGETAFDVFEGRVLGMGDRLLRPHEGALLQVAASSSTPRVVGDTGHLTFARLYQRQVSGRLQVRNEATHTRTVAIEARGRVFEIELGPGEMRWFD